MSRDSGIYSGVLYLPEESIPRMADMKTHCSNPAEVRAFCESVADHGTKNLQLLKAINSTIDWLVALQRHARVDIEYAERMVAAVKECQREPAIDENGEIVDGFRRAERVLTELHETLKRKCEAAARAKELDADDKAAVVGEYRTSIAAIADLHNGFVDLRWAILEHDADTEKDTGERFGSVEEMLSANR